MPKIASTRIPIRLNPTIRVTLEISLVIGILELFVSTDSTLELVVVSGAKVVEDSGFFVDVDTVDVVLLLGIVRRAVSIAKVNPPGLS
jgi:hypothetical protein